MEEKDPVRVPPAGPPTQHAAEHLSRNDAFRPLEKYDTTGSSSSCPALSFRSHLQQQDDPFLDL